MKKLVLEKPGSLRLTEAPAPAAPGRGEARVRVHRVGICGTDLHAYRGTQPFFDYPRVVGHELGVEVLELGSEVTRLHVGDRCAVEPYLNCGGCVACRQGKTNCCVNMKVLGVHVDGGLCNEMILPAAKLHPSTRLSFDQLALVETLGIGCHAVARGQVTEQDTVLVIGTGPIGLSAAQFAVASGARVVVLDVNATRLAFCAEHLRLRGTILAGENVVAQVRDTLGGDLPTCVIDATGNPQAMARSFTLPAHGGRLVFVGLFQGDLTFNDPDFHKRELTVLASRNALGADFTRIIELIEAGRIDTSPWITHRAPLAEVPARFPQWLNPQTGCLKAMVEMA